MDRIAARNIVRRVLFAMIAKHQANQAPLPKKASLPTGNVLTGLDMLARAQFLEGLAGKPFGSISSKAGGGRPVAKKVIGKLLLLLDPTLNPADLEPKHEKEVEKIPAGPGMTGSKLNEWVSDAGASGLYRSAWLGANRALARTRGPTGSGLEATDVLTANMLRFIDPSSGEPAMDEAALEEFAQSASMGEKQEVLENQEKALRDGVLEEAANMGNFFWMAGKKMQAAKAKILSEDIGIDRLGGIVARYAFNDASKLVEKLETESRALARALKLDMLPGANEERADFDLGELTPTGWGYVIQAVLGDPNSHFSQEVFDWMLDDVKFHPSLNDKEKQVMTAYVQAVIDGRLSGFMSAEGASAGRGADRGFIEDYNRRNPDATITPNYFGVVKNKYLGKDGAEVAKRLHDEAPEWKLDAEDQLFLMNAQKGRGKFAAQKFAAEERALRSKIIRLAHQNPAMRPHLLPLLVRTAAGEEGTLAGRTWGGPGAGRDWDWNKPEYASHEDSPPAGSNGSTERAKYNKWYRENVCPSKHGTGCGL